MPALFTGALDSDTVAYVVSKYGQVSASNLATELNCSRNVIAGTWRRHRKENNLEPLRPYHDLNERNKEIFDRYKDLGQYASQIASEMGLSVNAVDNILKRLRRETGMKARGKPKAQPRKKYVYRKRTPKLGADGLPLPWRTPQTPHAPAYGPPVTFDQLDKIPLGLEEVCMCRHYVGNPTDSLFCGRPSVPGRAYCQEHTMLAYRARNAPPRTHDNEIKIKKQAKEFLEWRRRQVIEMRKAA